MILEKTGHHIDSNSAPRVRGDSEFCDSPKKLKWTAPFPNRHQLDIRWGNDLLALI